MISKWDEISIYEKKDDMIKEKFEKSIRDIIKYNC